MPYPLNLRLKSAEPVSIPTLRHQLHSAGLGVHPDSVDHGIFASGLAFLEIIADPDVPAGLGVLVGIPYGHSFIEVYIELLKLERIAGVIGAELVDGGEVMQQSGPAGLACIFGFHDRYERASGGARDGLEVA